MSEEDLTVFDIKYNESIERFNSLLSLEEETNLNSIKNYIEKYHLEKSLQNRIKNKENNKNNKTDEKRKQIVDLYEIRIHEKKTQQYYNKNYLKNEIEWFKIKQREDEIKNKYNSNYNKMKLNNDIINKEISKEIIRNNKIKMKKFANLANKVNIEKIKQQKKLSKNKDDLYQDDSIDNKDQGKFIPYNKYKEYNIQIRNRNKKEINKNKTNINTNKSETINNTNNNNKKLIKIENKINNHISQNINNIIPNNKSLEKNKPLKSLDNKNIIDKRKPSNEKIDYLKQFEKNKQENKIKIYENKKLKKNKNNPNNNIDILNYHCKNFEDKAKRQEQLMRVRGKSTDRNADNVKLSNLLIDSISTKLAILNQMAKNT